MFTDVHIWRGFSEFIEKNEYGEHNWIDQVENEFVAKFFQDIDDVSLQLFLQTSIAMGGELVHI